MLRFEFCGCPREVTIGTSVAVHNAKSSSAFFMNEVVALVLPLDALISRFAETLQLF
jgi:hypothetical protein